MLLMKLQKHLFIFTAKSLPVSAGEFLGSQENPWENHQTTQTNTGALKMSNLQTQLQPQHKVKLNYLRAVTCIPFYLFALEEAQRLNYAASWEAP